MAIIETPDIDDGRIVVHPLLTVREISRVLRLGQRTIWRLTSLSRAGVGAFPQPVRIGEKTVRWRWEDVEEYLRKRAGK